MGMTPRAEDFERLAIRWADASKEISVYPTIVSAMAAFPDLYAANRDSLPQNDTDRAFALVCKATDIVDDKMMYAASDFDAQKMGEEALAYLDEALKLDPACFDAERMRFALTNGVRDVMVDHLRERADEVRATCEKIARDNGIEAPEGRWSASVYLRPYLRWLLNLANEELNCGRYGRSLEACAEAMRLDASDFVGARLVAAFDHVKLDDAEGLSSLLAAYPDDHNAWFELSRVFMAYKQFRLDDASKILGGIVRAFPRAGYTLTYQDEVSVGMFGHLSFAPGSADELFIAVSEGAVILDENCGEASSALSDWVARDPMVRQAKESEDARWALEHPGEQSPDDMRRQRDGGAGEKGGR